MYGLEFKEAVTLVVYWSYRGRFIFGALNLIIIVPRILIGG